MKSMLKTENITKTFKNKETVLRGISLDIARESFTVLLGPSGSGKTTLLNVLSGLLKPTTGRIWYDGREMTDWKDRQTADWIRRDTGNVFQNYLLLEHLTVRENIEIGVCPGSDSISLEVLAELLEIHTLFDKYPAQLSGGQQQRTAIARAVIKKPAVLFCDEATGALDETNSKKVVSLLHNLRSTYGITVLFVTHNLQISKTADRVITIKDGRLFQDKLNEHPITAEEMDWGR